MHSLRLRAARCVALFFVFSVSGCACSLAYPIDSSDADQPDVVTTDASDANVTDASDANVTDASDATIVDAGYVFDGAVPVNAAVLFSGINLAGEARLVPADIADLGAFANAASSLVIPFGYTLYGTTLVNFGGDLSTPMVGPTTINDLGAFADVWDAVILRPSSEPVATVYRDVGAMPKVYPLGMFPSLGMTTDLIDGISLPDGVTFVGYDDPAFGGVVRGPYVGPANLTTLPFRDAWSSFVVRATTPTDLATGHATFFVDGNYGGVSVVLTVGQYPNLDEFPSTAENFNNRLTGVRGRSGLAVFGFEFANFGGNVRGPYTGDVTPFSPNDDWDSIVIQPSDAPTLTVYFDPGLGNPATYPIVNVSSLHGRVNQINEVYVPSGYVVHAFSHSQYGGLTGPGWIHPHAPAVQTTVGDDWDSFIVRPVDEPTVTLYFGANRTNPRVYPLASYPSLQTVANQVIGADVPCGVRIRAFDNDDFTGTAFVTVTGPVDVASVTGNAQWNSMHIERVVGAVCP